MITFIKHFPLVVPISVFRFHPIPIFLKFYLPTIACKMQKRKIKPTSRLQAGFRYAYAIAKINHLRSETAKL